MLSLRCWLNIKKINCGAKIKQLTNQMKKNRNIVYFLIFYTVIFFVGATCDSTFAETIDKLMITSESDRHKYIYRTAIEKVNVATCHQINFIKWNLINSRVRTHYFNGSFSKKKNDKKKPLHE